MWVGIRELPIGRLPRTVLKMLHGEVVICQGQGPTIQAILTPVRAVTSWATFATLVTSSSSSHPTLLKPTSLPHQKPTLCAAAPPSTPRTNSTYSPVDSKRLDLATISCRANSATLRNNSNRVRGGQPLRKAHKDEDPELSVNCTCRPWRVRRGVVRPPRTSSINNTLRLTTQPLINNKAGIQTRLRARAWRSAPRCRRHMSGSRRPLVPIWTIWRKTASICRINWRQESEKFLIILK